VTSISSAGTGVGGDGVVVVGADSVFDGGWQEETVALSSVGVVLPLDVLPALVVEVAPPPNAFKELARLLLYSF